MKLWMKVVVASIVAVGIWIGAWFSVWAFAQSIPSAQAAMLGQVGDMFGAGNALFSGIAVAAVVIVLTFDMRERSKDLAHRENELLAAQQRLRPFVVPQLPERDGCTISDPKRNASGVLSLVVNLTLDLRNHTGDVALNVATQATLTGFSNAFEPFTLGLPLVQSAPATRINLTGTLNGDSAVRFARALKGDGLKLRIECDYSSLNGTPWRSTSSIDLEARDKDARTLLNEAIVSEPGWGTLEGTGIGGGSIYPVASTVVPGTWKQEPVAGGTPTT